MSTDINDSPAATGGEPAREDALPHRTPRADPASAKASPLLRMGSWLRRGATDASGRQLFLEGGRAADAFYRRRWSHDKIARS